MTFEVFLPQAKVYPDLWAAITRRAIVPDDMLARAAQLKIVRHLLVMSEDWCGDAVNTVPWVAALANAMPGVDLRMTTRDDHLDVMDQHLTNGSRSIPVVMVLDGEFKELGWWGPRPTALQAWAILPETRALLKDVRYRELRRWYASDRGRTTLSEMLGLLERTATSD
jgi:hypothetical protein